jgi:hypothetical protein
MTFARDARGHGFSWRRALMHSISKRCRRFAPLLAFAALVCCGSSRSDTGVTSEQAPPTSGHCAMNGENCGSNVECCSHVCGSGMCAGASSR